MMLAPPVPRCLVPLLGVVTLGAVCNDQQDCMPPCFTWETCQPSTGACVQARCAVAADCGPHATCDRDGRCQPLPCSGDEDCDDGVFCNGTETCVAPSDEWPSGCRSDLPPCRSGEECDERYHLCGCAPDSDMDGDGADSYACGGNDCDDDDRLRYPANTERCDGPLWDGRPAADHDEDCDPCTLAAQPGPRLGTGDGDTDRDIFLSQRCTNPFIHDDVPPVCDPQTVIIGDGIVTGRDCAPDDPSVHPAQPEVCNHVDDNCDGGIDEGVTIPVFSDLDRDGAGQPGATVELCPQDVGDGYALFASDCDDRNPAIRPGAMRCAEGAGAIQICQIDATWLDAVCPAGGQQVCLPQTNGTGVCF